MQTCKSHFGGSAIGCVSCKPFCGKNYPRMPSFTAHSHSLRCTFPEIQYPATISLGTLRLFSILRGQLELGPWGKNITQSMWGIYIIWGPEIWTPGFSKSCPNIIPSLKIAVYTFCRLPGLSCVLSMILMATYVGVTGRMAGGWGRKR